MKLASREMYVWSFSYIQKVEFCKTLENNLLTFNYTIRFNKQGMEALEKIKYSLGPPNANNLMGSNKNKIENKTKLELKEQ